MRIVLLAGVLAAFAGAAMAQNLGMKEQGAIRWVCGGAGVEERAALAGLRAQANLELLFVTAKRGGYLADVEVALYAADRTAPVLQVTAEGPMCLISAPKGDYRIEAAYGGAKRTLRVAANTRQARAVFAFPEEPWDGIRASDEEKQQARGQ
jgi:hypothetical protein